LLSEVGLTELISDVHTALEAIVVINSRRDVHIHTGGNQMPVDRSSASAGQTWLLSIPLDLFTQGM
jgi:hypothetical protein